MARRGDADAGRPRNAVADEARRLAAGPSSGARALRASHCDR